MSTLKRTPLFDSYAQFGGKTIDFGGWELPVQFSSIKEEHAAVREAVGLFDVSHMGEVFVEGPGSLAYLQKLHFAPHKSPLEIKSYIELLYLPSTLPDTL